MMNDDDDSDHGFLFSICDSLEYTETLRMDSVRASADDCRDPINVWLTDPLRACVCVSVSLAM